MLCLRVALLLLGVGVAVRAQDFNNPVIYEDYPDNDIFLGPDGKTYYMSTSSFHYSPGAPILSSTDLVNWQPIGHSVPSLDFGSQYSLENNQTAYNSGIWASTLRYRESNNQWYWIGCIGFWTTYIYTAPSVTGPWQQSASIPGTCFYDCGLLIDDNDIMYVAYGSDQVHVAQLSSDGLSIVQTQQVFSYPSECPGGIEGNRMYKINGLYYILDDCPAQGITEIWKASNPFGPYTRKILSNGTPSPVPGSGSPDQGSLIKTPNGAWYFMSFAWAYPLGRLPILAPVSWGSDGFPVLETVNGAWGASYPYPLPEENNPPSWIGGDTFWELGPAWEWNHNPDTTKFSLNYPGLTLQTATVTTDLFHAKNTLTHRVNGQYPVGTVQINFSNMADGDMCGLAAFRDESAWIGVVCNGNSYTITAVQGLIQDPNNYWATTSEGYLVGTASILPSQDVWLQVRMDARANGSKQGTLAYSTDGITFTQLGGAFTLDGTFNYFMGYRYGIFNFATKTLGGSIKVVNFVSWGN